MNIAHSLIILKLSFPLAKKVPVLLKASFHLKGICTSDGGILASKAVI